MDNKERIYQLKNGNIQEFWGLCTDIIVRIYYLSIENDISTEESKDIMLGCIVGIIDRFSDINTASEMSEYLYGIFDSECKSRNMDFKVSQGEFFGNDIPAEVMSELTMSLGVYNKNSEIAQAYLAKYASQEKKALPHKKRSVAIVFAIAILIASVGVLCVTVSEGQKRKDKADKENLNDIYETESTDEFPVMYGEEQGMMEYFNGAEWQYESGDVRAFENVVFPAVHDENDGECIFIWDKTEQDIRVWFQGKYADYIVKDRSVSEKGGNHIIDTHRYYETRNEEEYTQNYDIADGEAIKNVGINCTSSGYSSKYVNAAGYQFESDNLEEMLEEVAEFLAFMGLEDYAYDIIRTPSDTEIIINTENGLGEYHITTWYYCFVKGTVEAHQFSVNMEYKDAYFDNYAIIPENMCELSEVVKVADWFSTENASNLEIMEFSKAINYHINGLETGNYTYTHDYSADEEAAFEENKEGRYEFAFYNKSRYDCITVEKDDDIYIKIRPYEYYKASNYGGEYSLDSVKPNELTKDMAERIASERLNTLRIINPSFDFSLEEVVENLQTNWNKSDEEQVFVGRVFYSGDYSIELKNDLNFFELKIYKTVTE